MLCHCRHLILVCPLLLITLLAHSQQTRTDTLTLHFAFNSHQIQPGDSARLREIFSNSSVAPISITGYTDKVGTASYNHRLSSQRAHAAFQLIPHASQVSGKGVAPTADRSDSENRRVEIVYYSIVHSDASHYDTITRNPGHAVDIRPRPDSIIVVKRRSPENNAMPGKDSISGGNDPADSARPEAVLALRHINFVVDTPIPTDSTRLILPEFVTELLQFKDHQLEIDGYVNSIVPLRGKNDPLYILSVRRAKFIYDYLVNAGFDPGKLTYKGMGNASPVNPHPVTTKEMNANMRVEIKVF